MDSEEKRGLHVRAACGSLRALHGRIFWAAKWGSAAGRVAKRVLRLGAAKVRYIPRAKRNTVPVGIAPLLAEIGGAPTAIVPETAESLQMT
jgi:hypothetical protein